MTPREAEAALRRPCDPATETEALAVLAGSPDPMHQMIVKEWPKMAENINDGGPAFPNPSLADENYRPQPGDNGMTLRDYFAGQALAGLAGMNVNDGSDFLHPLGVKSAAQWAYTFADAMIAARGGAA